MSKNNPHDVVCGKRLRECREEKGLTQQQVSERSKITLRNYQKIEKGEQNPRVTTALLISNALSSTIDELFTSVNK